MRRAQTARGSALSRRWLALGLVSLAALLLLLPSGTGTSQGLKSDVLLSSHNLSVTGPGPVTSSEEDACIFCHTPHTSFVDVKPLWNHELSTQTYNTYTSSTFDAGAATPSAGVSRLCLSCHDGTVALGQTVSEGLIPTTGGLSPGATLGTDLTNDHPLAIQPVDDGQLVLTLFQSPPVSSDAAVQLPGGRIECTSCHDPHSQSLDAVAQSFLVRSNSGGTVCLACHDPSRPQPNALNGWLTGAHSNAVNTVPTTSSFGPYGNVSANACGNCHSLHGAGVTAAARLLRGAEETACSSCHAGANVSPALPDVLGDFGKAYAHPATTLSGLHDPSEDTFPLNANRHAECPDCHNPHAAGFTVGTEVPPGVEAPLAGASGFDGAAALRPAANEYEVCFKCHADSSNKPQNTPGFSALGRIPPRWGEQTVADPHNLRQKFASSFARHNVTQPRRLSAAEVPSLRSFMLNIDGSPGRSLAVGTYIYCTDCHASDQARKFNGSGGNGPHGSIYPHVLTRRFEQEIPPSTPGSGDGQGFVYTPGPTGPFALCDKCHDIENSITNDESFTRHNRHTLGEPASCSTCHDPHGVHDTGGNPTNNPRMVSFDLEVVGPDRDGNLRIDSVQRKCFLECHGTQHRGRGY